MTRYLILLSFTEQGMRAVQDSIKRASEFRSAVEQAGGSVLAQYWSLGEADGCVVFEAPNDECAARLLVALGRKGNVRTRSMRVFEAAEFARIAPAAAT